MSTAATPVYEWNALPWKRFERQVFKLQQRIYRASRRGDGRTVHKLQRLLMKSWAAKCLAVRRVTQDNRGKRTAGVDGVKNLGPAQRLALARTLMPLPTARPVRDAGTGAGSGASSTPRPSRCSYRAALLAAPRWPRMLARRTM